MKQEYKSAHDSELNLGNANQRAAHIKKEVTNQKGNLSFDKTLKGDIVRDLDSIISGYHSLSRAHGSKAGVNISFGDYVSRKYGIEKDANGSMTPFLKSIGVNPNDTRLQHFRDGSIRNHFSSTVEVDPTGSLEWLIGEYIADALRVGLNTRGVYRQLVQSMEMVPYDTIKTPIVKNPNGFMKQVAEHESVKFGAIEYDEIASELIEVGHGFSLSDKLMRNANMNILADFISGTTGKNLDKQLTKQAIDTLINGNDKIAFSDAAPIVGVDTIGSFDYDNDILEIVIAMAQLGYNASTVLADRNGIKQIMALPEFKGFDGDTTKAASSLFAVPMPSEYLFIPTGAMPASAAAQAKLLFLDNRFALKHYSSKPITIENDRVIENLRTKTVASMTTAFVKQYQDASILLDSGVNNITNPFPADLDAETTDGETF